MGEVVVILKIMPESPDVDLEKIQADIRAKVSGIEDMKVEPIGFGLSAIKIAMITEDDEGAGDKIEGLFSQIPGMKRGARGHPIGIRDKLRNLRISRKRSKGERPYAVIKNVFHAGLVKVTTLQKSTSEKYAGCILL